MSDRGPVRLMFDNSPPDGSPGVLLGFLEGRHARELGRVRPEERRSAVLDYLRAASSATAPRARATTSSGSGRRRSGPAGCYGCHMPTGAWTNYGPALHAPIGPIHWAGAEYAHVWNGYMDGAVRSGETTASRILELL